MPSLGDVPPAMLQDYMTKLFKIGDVNSDGVLLPYRIRSSAEDIWVQPACQCDY